MVALETIRADWRGECCIVAASGPSLTADVAETCGRSGWRVVVVNDAWRMIPTADALYACDSKWWTLHDGARGFAGERWTTHESLSGGHVNDKAAIADQYGLRCVRGTDGEGFSRNPAVLHYGSNSGFQAINLALLKGARVALVGFDMRHVNGRAHYFGEHPDGLRRCSDYRQFLPAFERAAKLLPAGVEIINATPDSALRCFAMMTLDNALALGSRANLRRA